jgi:diguanylate cyclase (GGDEF)-like protein
MQGEPWWPESVSNAPWPVFFYFSALFLLGGLYGVTWRRAYLDELTGVPTRRAFDESLQRLGRNYTIAMVDVDHFKRFNDRYGHQVGDEVLQFIAARLKRLTLGQAFRYGGEEFAIVIPGQKIHEALPLLEGLRQSIESYRFAIREKNRPLNKPREKTTTTGGNEEVRVTVSIGVAERDFLHSTAEAVVKTADEALYQAKRMGRNRVEQGRRRKGGEGNARKINCRSIEKERGNEKKLRGEAQVGSPAIQVSLCFNKVTEVYFSSSALFTTGGLGLSLTIN